MYTYDNSSLGSLRPDYPATFPGSDSNEVAISSSQCEQSVQIVDNEGLRDTVETDHKHSTESVVEDSEIQSKEEDPESTDTELERTEREQTESVAVRIGTWVTSKELECKSYPITHTRKNFSPHHKHHFLKFSQTKMWRRIMQSFHILVNFNF